MIIRLLLNHTALIEDDGNRILTAPCAGTATIQGKTIRTGEVVPPLFAGSCTMTFMTDNGVLYTDTHVVVGRDGVAREHIDSSRMVEVLVMLDQIIRNQTDHTARLNRIEGRASGGVFELFRPKNQNQEDNQNA